MRNREKGKGPILFWLKSKWNEKNKIIIPDGKSRIWMTVTPWEKGSLCKASGGWSSVWRNITEFMERCKPSKHHCYVMAAMRCFTHAMKGFTSWHFIWQLYILGFLFDSFYHSMSMEDSIQTISYNVSPGPKQSLQDVASKDSYGIFGLCGSSESLSIVPKFGIVINTATKMIGNIQFHCYYVAISDPVKCWVFLWQWASTIWIQSPGFTERLP